MQFKTYAIKPVNPFRGVIHIIDSPYGHAFSTNNES